MHKNLDTWNQSVILEPSQTVKQYLVWTVREFSAEFATDLQFNNKLQLEVEMSIIYSPRECPVSVWVKYTIVQKPEWIIIKAKDNLGRQPFISSHYLIYLDHYPSSSQLTILLCTVFVLLNIILPLPRTVLLPDPLQSTQCLFVLSSNHGDSATYHLLIYCWFIPKWKKSFQIISNKQVKLYNFVPIFF